MATVEVNTENLFTKLEASQETVVCAKGDFSYVYEWKEEGKKSMSIHTFYINFINVSIFYVFLFRRLAGRSISLEERWFLPLQTKGWTEREETLLLCH